MHVPSHTPQTHLSVPPAREASRAKPEPLLSLSLHTHPKTCKLRGQIFSFSFPPSFPPQTDSKAGAGEPDARSAPAAPGDAGRPGGPGKAARAAAAGARSRSPPGRPGSPALTPPSPPSPAASGRQGLCPDCPGLPHRTSHPPRRQKEGSARSPLGHRRGGSTDPGTAAPHTKGLPGPGRSVGALVPAPRAGAHPPAGVCASVHRNAGGWGACGSRAARAGRGGTEGGGKRPEGRGAEASGAGRRRTGGRRRRGAGAGAPAWLGRPARAAPSAPGSARPARSAASGRRGARGGRSRRAGRGLGPRAPAGTGNALWSARPTGSV